LLLKDVKQRTIADFMFYDGFVRTGGQVVAELRLWNMMLGIEWAHLEI